MNAQNIWAGNDYAFRPGKNKGERFSLAAHRVRVRRVTKKMLPGNTKASTFVEVQFVDRDTGEPIESPNIPYYQAHRIEKLVDGLYQVKAFDFIEHWDNVSDEYHHLIEKQRQRELDRQAELRRQAEETERKERERINRLNSVQNYLIAKGINPEWIREVDPYYGVKLDFVKIEEAINQERKVGSLRAQRAISGSN